MGTITVLNNTDWPVNTTISAGVNYSWCNKLNPKTYYEHDGGAGVFTLHSVYWLGSATEYGHNVDDLGYFAGGTTLGIIGLAGGPAAVAFGLIGLAIGTISIVAKDFKSTPSDFTNIHAIHNRKFIIEGAVKGDVKDGTCVIRDDPTLTIRALEEKEYEAFVADSAWRRHDDQPEYNEPIGNVRATRRRLELDGRLNQATRVTSVLSGLRESIAASEACWEIGDDKDDGALQLWERNVDEPKAHWSLEPTSSSPDSDVFKIYNATLKQYLSAPNDTVRRGTIVGVPRDRLPSAPLDQASTNFYVVRTLLEGSDASGQWCQCGCHTSSSSDPDSNSPDHDTTESHTFNGAVVYSFIPVDIPESVVVPTGGELGRGTKLTLAPLTTSTPWWGRWVLTPMEDN